MPSLPVQQMPVKMKAQGAYISNVTLPGATAGPLANKTVAIKDLFDIAGHRTGFGHPLWLDTHPEAASTAPVVQRLLDAGASVQGKTHMDELAYSLNGENFHYGTPVNPAAPERIPGGSSSGSAVAVAAGDVDIGLGSDTGGSVRVPASYCGLFGIRPTHGRVSLAGARPLAPSFDTVGWFTRTLGLLAATATVLLDAPSHTTTTTTTTQPPPTTQRGPSSAAPIQWLLPSDIWELALPDTAVALRAAVAAAARDDRDALALSALVSGESDRGVVRLASSPALQTLGVDNVTTWLDVFRICQAWEIWKEHGAWITQHKPTFGPGTKERFAMAAGITEEEFQVANGKRQVITAHLTTLLGDRGVLVLPTAPGAAPYRETPAAQLDDWRKRLLSMTCIAGLAGLPQISLPLASVDGLPVSLSFIGPKGSDEYLIEVAKCCTPPTLQ